MKMYVSSYKSEDFKTQWLALRVYYNQCEFEIIFV